MSIRQFYVVDDVIESLTKKFKPKAVITALAQIIPTN